MTTGQVRGEIISSQKKRASLVPCASLGASVPRAFGASEKVKWFDSL